MMGEEAGGLLFSLTGMLKIYLSDSGIKVPVPEPLLYKRTELYVFNDSTVRGALLQSLCSIFCYDSG